MRLHLIDCIFAALLTAPIALVIASAAGPHTCSRDVELTLGGRYAVFQTCKDRFGMASDPKFVRYADRYIDPVTGEVF